MGEARSLCYVSKSRATDKPENESHIGLVSKSGLLISFYSLLFHMICTNSVGTAAHKEMVGFQRGSNHLSNEYIGFTWKIEGKSLKQ